MLAGEWLTAATAANEIVQFNPRIADQNTSALLYSERPALAANETCMSTFGGDPALCPSIMAELSSAFPPDGQPAAPDLAGVCRATPINFVAAIDTDVSPMREAGSEPWKAASPKLNTPPSAPRTQ